MSRCTPGHGWTSRKRRLGGGGTRLIPIRAEQIEMIRGRRVVLRIALRQAMDDAIRPVAEREADRSKFERLLAQLQIEEDFLVGNPSRVLSRGTLIALGIIEDPS